MSFQSRRTARARTVLATAAVLSLAMRAGLAQDGAINDGPQPIGPSSQYTAPQGPSGQFGGSAYSPGGGGASPGTPPGGYATPPSPTPPPADSISSPGPGTGGFGTPPTAADAGGDFDPGFTGGQFAALGGGGLAIADNPGYIDSAIIRSRIRIRYDAGYGFNTPDKAEFFYPKCGCLGNPANFLTPDGRFVPSFAFSRGFDPRATGPQVPNESSVDYQEIRPYLEVATSTRTSGFIEMPARFIDPQKNANAFGWSDMNLGFKHAIVANPDQFYTFQFRTYVPTGVGQRGLGTNHATLEPGFLVFQRLTDRLYFNGELRDWIPVHASDFAGNVLIYGAGLTYNVVLTEGLRVAPVSEFVGWSILSGKQSDLESPTGVSSASGQTIVNAKIGLRVGLGDYKEEGGGSALNDRHSLYAGYGRVLTGDHWYSDMFRLEYNFLF